MKNIVKLWKNCKCGGLGLICQNRPWLLSDLRYTCPTQSISPSSFPSFHHHCTLQIRGASARWWAIRQGHWSFLKTMKTVLWKQRAKVEGTYLCEDSSPLGAERWWKIPTRPSPGLALTAPKKDHGYDYPLGTFQKHHWNSPTQKHWRDQKRCFWLNIYHRWTLSLSL